MARNVLEKINPKEVIHLSMINKNGDPHILILTNDDYVTHPLNDGWEVFQCNGFLRSLHLVPDERICFDCYVCYGSTIEFCNRLLEYRTVMEEVTGKPYDEIDVLAYQVHSIILDRLLAKHHMTKLGYEAAMLKRPLKEWVAEALSYFK